MKKILAIIITFLVLFSVFSFAFAAENGLITTVKHSDEIPQGFTAIYTPEDLNDIRNNLDGKYILMENIDLSSCLNWTPIGTYDVPFTGVLDGNGFSVNNLNISITSQENEKVFGVFGSSEGAVIKNLSVINAIVKASFSTSSISTHAFGTIIGWARENTLIENCLSTGSINVDSNCSFNIGGITGLGGNIKKCAAKTTLSGKSSSETSYFTMRVGGISASAQSIEQSYNSGELSIASSSKRSTVNIGGIVADCLGYTVTDCYNIGNITAYSAGACYVGGIAGYSGTLINCYNKNTFDVSGAYENGYGISGYTVFWSKPALEEGNPEIKSELKNCYYLDNCNAPVKNTEESLMLNIKALTAEEFANQDSFAGFDFENIWLMDKKAGRPVFIDKNAEAPITTKEETSVSPVTTERTTTTEIITTTFSDNKETTSHKTTTEQISENPEPSTTAKVENISEASTVPSTESTTQISTTTGHLTGSDNQKCWLVKFLEQFCFFVVNLIVQIFSRLF